MNFIKTGLILILASHVSYVFSSDCGKDRFQVISEDFGDVTLTRGICTKFNDPNLLSEAKLRCEQRGANRYTILGQGGNCATAGHFTSFLVSCSLESLDPRIDLREEEEMVLTCIE